MSNEVFSGKNTTIGFDSTYFKAIYNPPSQLVGEVEVRLQIFFCNDGFRHSWTPPIKTSCLGTAQSFSTFLQPQAHLDPLWYLELVCCHYKETVTNPWWL